MSAAAFAAAAACASAFFAAAAWVEVVAVVVAAEKTVEQVTQVAVEQALQHVQYYRSLIQALVRIRVSISNQRL